MRALFFLNQAKLSAEEIRKMVDPSVLEYLKSDKKDPLLKAFVVAHEGTATPQFEAGYTGEKILKFTKDSVSKVFSAIKLGVKFFYDHYKKSPDENRKSVGKIVGKAIQMIGDKLSTIVIAFIEDEDYKDYNNVSMEADLEIDQDGTVSDVLDFSAIALVPTDQEPALAGATSLGMIRAHKQKGKFKMNEQNNLDWHSIEAGFRQLKGLPSQVSDPEEMIGRIELTQDGRLIATGKDKKYSEYVLKLAEQFAQQKLQTVNPEIDKIKAERDALAKKVTLYEVKPKVLEKAKDYKLGDGFLDFVSKRIDRFKPNENDIDGSIVEWLEDKKLDFSDIASKDQSNGVQGVPANRPVNNNSAEIDYTDPKNNPLLA